MSKIGLGFKPYHPEELLKSEIEYRGLSKKHLAEDMGISYKSVNDILNARKPISAETAMLFVKALNLDNPDLLLGLQIDYDKQILMQSKSFMKL
jgi:addiction module HigA family antidote